MFLGPFFFDRVPRSQNKIRQWIEAIPHHIKEIIRLDGGNKYKEHERGFKRCQAEERLTGKLSKLQYVDQKDKWAINKRNSDDGGGGSGGIFEDNRLEMGQLIDLLSGKGKDNSCSE